MKTSQQLYEDLQANVTRTGEKLEQLKRYFKTGPGGYGEGDIFIGVTLPDIRKVCKKYSDLSLQEIDKALQNPVHEVRLAAVIIMANQSKKADEISKKALHDLYLSRTDKINNWDLVDVSCPRVVGDYLLNKPRAELAKLARSKNIWDRRIAVISTFAFLAQKECDDTYKIATILVNDQHDLIQKAVGWALREAGKKCDPQKLRAFLDAHAATMPRVALRYAIEKFDEPTRKHYLELRVK